MRIIGLDLSLTAPGYCVVDPREFGKYPPEAQKVSITTGVLQPQGRGLDRMDWICRQVLRLLPAADATGHAEVVVYIEGFSFGSKGAALYEIAGLGYIVRLALQYRGVKVVEVAPSQLKRFATGAGNAKKEIIIREVFKRWKFEAATNDEADAYVLGRIGMCVAGLDQPTTAEQREVLAALRGERPTKKRKVA
jgi:Holliday junction resolvasome RuvABC endonuclease subunit